MKVILSEANCCRLLLNMFTCGYQSKKDAFNAYERKGSSNMLVGPGFLLTHQSDSIRILFIIFTSLSLDNIIELLHIENDYKNYVF